MLARLNDLRGEAAALCAGLLWPLGFAPNGLTPVPLLALALALATWCTATPWRAFGRGWLFGAGAYGAGVGWVYISIHQFGNAGLPLALTMAGLLVAYLALFPAVLASLIARIRPDAPAALPAVVLLLAGGWTLLEWLRGWLLTGFPWLAIGYSQIDTPLAALAPLAGVHGVGLAAALSAGLLWTLTRTAWRGRLAALLLLAGLWGGAWLAGGLYWSVPAGEPLRVTLVQGNVSQDVKWLADERETTLARYAALTAENWESDLVIWPETAVPVFRDRVAGFLDRLERDALAHGTDLLLGIPVREEDGRYYNAMLALGATPGIYRKRHLVPFGEYLPFAAQLGWLLEFLQIPMSDFSAGDASQPLLRVAGHPVGVSICFEDVFARDVRSTLPEAALLINASNDAWFGTSMAPFQHLEIARMRAVESGRWLLRSTNTGISAVIGPRGEVVARSPQFEVATLHAEVVPLAGATPFVLFGHLPVLLLSLVAVAAAVGLSRRLPRSR